jgi:hypothetical protein
MPRLIDALQSLAGRGQFPEQHTAPLVTAVKLGTPQSGQLPEETIPWAPSDCHLTMAIECELSAVPDFFVDTKLDVAAGSTVVQLAAFCNDSTPDDSPGSLPNPAAGSIGADASMTGRHPGPQRTQTAPGDGGKPSSDATPLSVAAQEFEYQPVFRTWADL